MTTVETGESVAIKKVLQNTDPADKLQTDLIQLF